MINLFKFFKDPQKDPQRNRNIEMYFLDQLNQDIQPIKLMKTKIKFDNNTESGYTHKQMFKISAGIKRGERNGVPFVSIINSERDENSARYSGTSLVFFPIYNTISEDEHNLVGIIIAWGIGTAGEGEDEILLESPGHIRRFEGMIKAQNIPLESKNHYIYWNRSPLEYKRCPHSVINKVNELYALEKTEVLTNREEGGGGYGEYLYAFIAMKVPGEDEELNKLKELLNGVIKHFVYERAINKEEPSKWVNNWYNALYVNPKPDEIEDKLLKNRYLVLIGPPGTRKTDYLEKIKNNNFKKNASISCQFHPNTTYNEFIGGIQPVLKESSEGSDVNFEFKKGALINAIERAEINDEEKILITVDELNRADLVAVLGESIQLFEKDKEYEVAIANYKHKVKIPKNLYFLGTMNTSDRNISTIDVAIRRRFAFLNIWPEEPDDINEEGKVIYRKLRELFIEYGTDEDLKLMPGGFYFLKEQIDNMNLRLIPLLEDYCNENRLSNLLKDQLLPYINNLKMRNSI